MLKNPPESKHAFHSILHIVFRCHDRRSYVMKIDKLTTQCCQKFSNRLLNILYIQFIF